VLCGPSACFITLADSFTKPFALAHAGSFSLLTQHYYRGFGFGTQTIDVLLGPDPDLGTGLDVLRTTARARESRTGWPRRTRSPAADSPG